MRILHQYNKQAKLPDPESVPIGNPLRAYWTGVDMSSDGGIFVACAQKLTSAGTVGFIYLSFDNGVSWTEITNTIPGDPGERKRWNDITISGDGTIIYAAEKQSGIACYIYKYVISTATWSQLSLTSTVGFNDIDCSENGQYVTVVRNAAARCYVSADYGATFTIVLLPDDGSIGTEIAMSPDGSMQIITTSYSGTWGYIFKSVDYGVTFARVMPIDYAINDAAISADGTKMTFALINKASILMSNNGTFTEIALPESRNWRAVAMSDDGNIQILAGASSYLYLYNATNGIWYNSFVGQDNDWGDLSISADGSKRVATAYSEGSVGGYIYIF